MSDGDVPGDLGEAVEEELARHRQLAADLAHVAEVSAEVHEQAALVHEDLDDPLLDPADLRRHAQRDRALAARERRAAQEDADELGSRGVPQDDDPSTHAP